MDFWESHKRTEFAEEMLSQNLEIQTNSDIYREELGQKELELYWSEKVNENIFLEIECGPEYKKVSENSWRIQS
jgi:membrane-bound lytic murein transglycosylase